MVRAEIIAIGSELLTPSRIDTNSLFITEELNKLGVDVVEKHIVGDEHARLTEAVRRAVRESEIVILSGGLGPTEDDVTREAAAAALGRELIWSPEQEKILVERFQQINRKMADINRRQTFLIDGAEALPNPNGTAPGQFFRTTNGGLFLLPGPPRELKPMMHDQVIPLLRPMLPPQVIRTRVFRVTGIGESDLDALIAPIYTKFANPTTTVLSAPGDLSVTLFARSSTEREADALLKEAGEPIAQLLGDRVYSLNDEPLEMVVGNLLRERKATIATAESCTGGLIAARLTDHAGSSDFFVGSFVTYNDHEKQQLLGIPKDMLDTYTAVSEPVARAMADAAKRNTGATYALSVTGFAGPDGGTDENPVGTVFIGLASPQEIKVRRIRYGLDRARIRMLATQAAIDLLRRELLQSR
jgi:nicotinamide-nucleotide amidase